MQMVVPDYWKGRGRYSKRACSRKIKDDMPYGPQEKGGEAQAGSR
ncbi:MAG: hypothetical protein ACOC78_01755 [Actinomycetota bacterium]